MMINLLLAATLLCPVIVPPGAHDVEITAYYYHERPTSVPSASGGPYVFRSTEEMVGPFTSEIVAEGHPWRVVASISGVQVAGCVGVDAIFIDGFETGNLKEWH